MKKIQKLLALLLAVLMMVSVFAACAKSEPKTDDTPSADNSTQTSEPAKSDDSTPAPEEEKKEEITLEWFTRGPGMQTNTAHVNEAFNELLHTYEGFENISVHFNPYVADDYQTAVTLAQTAGQQIDILCLVSLSLTDQARNGALMPLDDLLATYTDLYNELPEWLWKTQIVDGSIYSVPNYQRGSNPGYTVIPAEYADCIDWDAYCAAMKQNEEGATAMTVRELADILEEYLLKVREKTGSSTKYLMPIGQVLANGAVFEAAEYVDANTVDQGSTCYINPFDSDLEVKSYFQTEAFKEAWEISCEWYEKGYFPEAAITEGTGSYLNGNMMNDEAMIWAYGTSTAPTEADTEGYLKDTWGFEVKICFANENAYMTNNWGASGNAISATCEHPEEAMAFLQLLNTEAGKDLYNMVVYGIEGEDYEKIDDNHIKTLYYDGSQAGSDAPYSAHKWCVGNTFHAYLNQACSDNENVWALEINNNANSCPWMGLRIDTTDISNDVSVLHALEQEWIIRTWYGIDGTAGFATAYDELMTKLDAANIQTVIDALQAQVDAYVGK